MERSWATKSGEESRTWREKPEKRHQKGLQKSMARNQRWKISFVTKWYGTIFSFTNKFGRRMLCEGYFVWCELAYLLGPSMHLVAAQHFYKALKVYPNTSELLEIYKKTVSSVQEFKCEFDNRLHLTLFSGLEMQKLNSLQRIERHQLQWSEDWANSLSVKYRLLYKWNITQCISPLLDSIPTAALEIHGCILHSHVHVENRHWEIIGPRISRVRCSRNVSVDYGLVSHTSIC